MKLEILMQLDNESFSVGETDEAKRAICDALEKLRGQWSVADASHPISAIILDSNGNTVGKATVSA